MKKIVAAFVLLSLNSFAQTLTQSVPLNISKKSDVFQVVEESKKQISLFFNDRLKVRTIRFDENFNIIDSLSSDRPSKDYDDIIGYSISGNKYYSCWSNSNNKEIASQCFDFEGKKVSMNAHSLEFVKEKPIKKITVNNIFYLITIVKNTSILNFYVFSEGKMEKKSVDLSTKNFVTRNNQRSNLWEILTESTDFEPSLSVQNILEETPPSLAFSANRRKTYIRDNSLIFTFDNNTSFTQFLTINLNDFTFILKSFVQPYIEPNGFDEIKSNSFLVNDHIVQVKLDSSVMQIFVKDLEGNELKKFSVYEGKEISFKNSEIIQENGSIKNTRILDKSNQLLRKIAALNPSISCYSFDNKIYLTIGAVSLVQNNAILYGGMIGGLTGALIGAAISSNYSMNNLNSYKDRKVVYINCLFDQQFNPIKGEVKSLPFDELRKFDEKNNWWSDKTIFKINSNLYYGAYSVSEKKYSFYKF